MFFDLEEPSENLVTFYCHHCENGVPYSIKEIDFYKDFMNKVGGCWWTCPVCGCKDYFEDVFRLSDYKEKKEKCTYQEN